MFTDLELSHIATIPFALPLMLAFVLLANVVLVNLLIAMFADTYSRIKSNAETEYHYQRFLHIFEYLHVVETIPPPLSAPWLLLAALHEALSFVGLCGRSEQGCARCAQRHVWSFAVIAAARCVPVDVQPTVMVGLASPPRSAVFSIQVPLGTRYASSASLAWL